MPQEKLYEWKNARATWLQARGLGDDPADLDRLSEHDRHEFHSLSTRQWHQWLDAGHGECLLQREDLRRFLVARLTSGTDSDWFLDARVIMPNHFHALVTPRNLSLCAVVRRWKGGSSHDINALLGRSGALWQAEPYDHIVRSEGQLQHYRRYIANNPIVAKLPASRYTVGCGKVAWASAQDLREHFEEMR